MRTTRPFVAGSMTLAMALAGGIVWSQQPEGGQQGAQMEGALLLEDFDQPVGGRWTGGIQREEAEDGESVGHWYAALNRDQIILRQVPLDWTAFKVLEFWMWSAVANRQQVMITVESPNGETDGMDYFCRRLVVDWDGWKQVLFPLESLNAARKPDWAKVQGLGFATNDWGIEGLEDTDLFIDAIRLLPDMPPMAERPAGLISDFEEQDLLLWSGLTGDAQHVAEGESAGRWERLDINHHVSLKREMDWTPYQYFEFDCYSDMPTGDRFLLGIWSMDPAAEQQSYWAYIVPVNWAGPKHFKLPFRRLYGTRNPLGWDRVTGIHMFPDGWGIAPASPDTVLVFDNMRLTEGEPRDVRPGLIDDFEEGPWAWWWMDEGSVEAYEGEHCGQFCLHEGRRWAVSKPLTTDWTGYTQLKLAVYTRNLDGEVLQIQAGRWRGEVPLDGEGWREVALPLGNIEGSVSGVRLNVKGLKGDEAGEANRDLDPAAILCLDNIRLE